MSLCHLLVDHRGLDHSMRSFIGHRLDCLRGIVNQWAHLAKGLAERGERRRGHRVEAAKMEALKKNLGIVAALVGLWLIWGSVFITSPAAEVAYSSDQYWIGKGQGDLTKGKLVCQRVSELSSRTDLAKQIRVLVKEHMIDRVRERSGRESEQDIELTREEIVQEYLQDVKIIDRRIDEENKTCTATAVMPKSRIKPKLVPDVSEPTPTVTH